MHKALTGIRHVALDLDGTVYRGGSPFDFTPAFLEQLKSLGIGRTFLTNNSSKSVADYVSHLRRMGIDANAGDIATSTLHTIDYLRARHPGVRRVFVLGTDSLQDELREHGFTVTPPDEEPEAVIVGFDTGLAYDRLCAAAWWISRGRPFIATHPDRVCPTDRPTVFVDCGAICACLTSATGIRPEEVCGKPNPEMLGGILRRFGLQPEQLAMAGDRLYTDIAMAKRAGAFGVLVLTGESTADDAAAASEPPDLVVPSLKEFGEMLEESRGNTA